MIGGFAFVTALSSFRKFRCINLSVPRYIQGNIINANVSKHVHCHRGIKHSSARTDMIIDRQIFLTYSGSLSDEKMDTLWICSILFPRDKNGAKLLNYFPRIKGLKDRKITYLSLKKFTYHML